MGQYQYPQPQPYRPQPQPYQPPKQGVPPQLIFIGAAVIVVMLITAGIVYMMWPEAKAPFVLELSATEDSVDQGAGLTMTQNLPPTDELTIISYTASHLISKQVVAQKSESISANSPVPTSYTLDIPVSASPGQYVLTAEAKRGSRRTQTQFSFRVKKAVIPVEPIPTETPDTPVTEPEPEVLECPDGCNDYNQCTTDRCVEGVCKYQPFTPCCGNNQCEPGETAAACPQDCQQRGYQKSEVVNEITDRALEKSSNTNEAIDICKSLSRPYDTDQCIKEIAVEAKDYEVCFQVVNVDDKDTCLFDHAVDNADYVACDHVQNRWLRDACHHHKRLKELGA